MDQRRTTAKQKGNELEDAVCLIEETILTFEPGLADGTSRVSGPVRIVVDGILYEADVLVRVTLGARYDSTFIFECKNWSERVGRVPITAFSETVSAFQAQRGFFVAKAYTRDAMVRAMKDPSLKRCQEPITDFRFLTPFLTP
jgi:hypothetical protein